MSFTRILKISSAIISLGVALLTWFFLFSPSITTTITTTSDDDAFFLNACPRDPYLDNNYHPATVLASTTTATTTTTTTTATTAATNKDNHESVKNALFSSTKNDPRGNILIPNFLYYSHCELSRWVQPPPPPPRPSSSLLSSSSSTATVREKKESVCPAGHEFVTVIRPTRTNNINQQGSTNGDLYEGIPKIIHIASPTNCLPSGTIEALRQLSSSRDDLQNNNNNDYTIYIHSNYAMDRFLFAREWNVFPEVKEGTLCVGEQIKSWVLFVLEYMMGVGVGVDVNVDADADNGDAIIIGDGNGHVVATTATTNGDKKHNNVDFSSNTRTAKRTHNRIAAEQIALESIRDIWRYLILWEYGGIVLDVHTLNYLLLSKEKEGGGGGTDAANDHYLKDVLHSYSKNHQDALLYWISTISKSDPQRMPFTNVMGMRPHHPFIYFTLKRAMQRPRYTLEAETPFRDDGRVTNIASISQGLSDFLPSYKKLPFGTKAHIGTDGRSIHFLNGDGILPKTLTSPSLPWQLLFSTMSAYMNETNSNFRDSIQTNLINAKQSAAHRNHELFSCTEYRLNMYLQKMSTEKL